MEMDTTCPFFEDKLQSLSDYKTKYSVLDPNINIENTFA